MQGWDKHASINRITMSVNLLAHLPFFADLPPKEIDLLASAFDVVNLKSGDILFREGDLGEHLFIVSSGVLEILTGLDTADELVVNLLSEGEYLGEGSLIFSDSRRTASARARGDAVLLSLSRNQFIEWLQHSALLAYPIIEAIARKANERNKAMLRDLIEKDHQLQQARHRLVTAVEEERRRLRRDLHDGLGPNLASQGLKLAAVKQLLQKDPTSAIPLLEQVMTQNQSTVEEVRRLVYGLRPPALDELGLVAALRDHVVGTDRNASLQIKITEPEGGLPPLSAAIEVAAYRIVLEALTNVIRHAQAHRCTIQFSISQNGSNSILQIEIQDDGIGLPRTYRAGVGTRSMCERAEELGGTCVIEPVMGRGTRVRAKMPLIAV